MPSDIGKVCHETIAVVVIIIFHLNAYTSKKVSFIYIEKENALQSAIRIGRIFPNKTHHDYFGLKILNTVLGGYFGSRLMKNIREDKGYTYGIGSGILSLKESGYFFISTEVGSDVTQLALNEIYKEIETIRTTPIPQEELDLVKNYLLGQLLSSCDGPFSMAAMFENANEYGLDYTHYNNYIACIKEISPTTLLELAVKYLNKSDLKELEKSLFKTKIKCPNIFNIILLIIIVTIIYLFYN